jgi:hypothetical protein
MSRNRARAGSMPRHEPDLTGRLEVVLDDRAPPGNVLAPLARLLRQIAERERRGRDDRAERASA